MAETAVGIVLDHLIPFLSQEASLLKGVHSQVLGIKYELQSIQCFLKDADRRAEAEAVDSTGRDDGVKAWVRQVREVAFQIEDVIAEYKFHMRTRPQVHGSFRPIRQIGRSIFKLKQRHEIATEIRDIKAKVRDIKERSERYGFDSIPIRQQGDDNNLASIFFEESDVVGIEDDRKKLISWLEDESPHRAVISIVGMGGWARPPSPNASMIV